MSIVSLKIGTLITVREVTQSLNDYGDATETYTDHAGNPGSSPDFGWILKPQ